MDGGREEGGREEGREGERKRRNSVEDSNSD